MTSFEPPTNTRVDTSSGFGLPRDLLDKSRRRIETVAWLILLGTGLDTVMLVGNLISFEQGILTDRPPLVWMVCSPIALVITIGMIVAARSLRVRDGALLSYALAFEVAHCFFISISNPVSFYQDHKSVPVLTWVTPLIIFFPLIVPCPPRRTLITAAIAAATAPVGLFIDSLAGWVEAPVDAYFAIAFGPLVAVAFAYFGSRVIYGLGLEVAAARRLGQYTLEEKLGEGGMGVVYRASHAMLRRPTAVKLLRPENSGERGLERFEREVQRTAALSHPNTVAIHDYGRTRDGVFYYAMEYLDGADLQRLVAEDGAQPPERVVHVLRQVLGALAEAHGVGLIHRDIKPANIILCERGGLPDVAKVVDFGLVKEVDASAGESREDALVGTPLYMAPESIGSGEATAASDLYAVGAVAYYLLTGSHVFTGKTALEVCSHHLLTPPVPPSQRSGRSLPPRLEAWVLRCLEKAPARRPAGAIEAAEELSASHDRVWDMETAREWWRVKGASLRRVALRGTSPGTIAVDLGRLRERA
ncbi:MAG: serine/threonine protein kinase [Vicinamibacteria bacterium]|nr:serine/threonine protein kinase [Vicinamibacteria bacterium]